MEKDGTDMNASMLNPLIRNLALYEALRRTGECIAADCRLFYLISGVISYSVRGEKRAHLTPGSLLYLPAGTPYQLKSKCFRAAVFSFDLVCTEDAPLDPIPSVASEEFHPESIRMPIDAAPFDKPILLDGMESERDSMKEMCDIFVSGEGNYRARLSAMLKLLLLRVAERVEDNALPAQMVDNLDSYIRENCGEEISNTELGAMFGYHPFYVSRMLKERRGITMHQYVIHYRMKLAKSLLACTDRTVTDIAEATGFTDSSYFTKSFKSEYGMTPKEFRLGLKDTFI